VLSYFGSTFLKVLKVSICRSTVNFFTVNIYMLFAQAKLFFYRPLNNAASYTNASGFYLTLTYFHFLFYHRNRSLSLGLSCMACVAASATILFAPFVGIDGTIFIKDSGGTIGLIL